MQRAEDCTRGMAQLYDKLGLPEYEAIEGFALDRRSERQGRPTG